jgi:hypothetical protein
MHWWRNVNQCTTEINLQVLQNLKIGLLYDPAIPHLGIYLKACKSVYNWDICTPMFIVALFHIPKYGSSLVVCPSTDEWIKKMWYIYIYIYIYTHTQWSIIQPQRRIKLCYLQKKNETRNHHFKWNKPEWERQILHFLSYMWNLDLKKRMTQVSDRGTI